MTTAYPHIEIVTLGRDRNVIEDIETDYFPSEIPNTCRGVVGRSHFSVFLTRPLPPGAIIQIAFRKGSVRESPILRQTATRPRVASEDAVNPDC